LELLKRISSVREHQKPTEFGKKQKKAFVPESQRPQRENQGVNNMPKMTAAQKLAEAKASVRAEAIRKTKAKRAAAGKAKKAPAKKAPVRTKGITNIIKKRKDQAERVFRQATGR